MAASGWRQRGCSPGASLREATRRLLVRRVKPLSPPPGRRLKGSRQRGRGGAPLGSGLEPASEWRRGPSLQGPGRRRRAPHLPRRCRAVRETHGPGTPAHVRRGLGAVWWARLRRRRLRGLQAEHGGEAAVGELHDVRGVGGDEHLGAIRDQAPITTNLI